MNNKTEIDYLNYNDLNLVEEKIKECTDRANEAMSPQINKVIDGKSTQETRSGKNLWKPIATATKSGITFTNNGDGSYTLNGTATSTTSFYISGLNYTAGTYTLSANNAVTNSNGAFYIQAEYSGGSITLTFTSLNANNTKTTTNSITACSVVIPNGITLTNFTFKPQLEAGSTATDFEQYGASPSPDYPSEIENIKGKNLWKPFVNETRSGITITQNADGSVLLNGTATGDIFFKIALDKSFNETTTLGYNYKDGSISNANIYVRTRNASGILIHTMALSSSSKKGINASTANTEISYQEITVQKGTTVSNVLLEIMLLKGKFNISTLPSYVPYGNIRIVETGKNLADINSIKIGKNWVNITDPRRASILNIPIEPNTKYTLSGNINSNTHLTTLRVVTFEKLGAIYHTGVFAGAFTTPSNAHYLSIEILADTTITSDMLKNVWVQLEKGTQATTYEPYTEEVVNIDLKGNELCSIGDIKDELIVKNGKASITKRIGEVVLDGSESWNISSYAPNQTNTIYFNSNKIDNLAGSTLLTSNYFTYVKVLWDKDVEGIFFDLVNKPSLRIRINKTTATTSAEFKTWLKSQYDSGNPVKVQYQLAEPYEIDLGPLEVYFTYETKKWEINELPYIQEIDRIEKGIYNLGEKYNRPKGWLPTKEWITKDNLYPIKGFDYRDWNRWVNNLNIFTTDIVVKDTIWNGASFINWEQIGKDEWR